MSTRSQVQVISGESSPDIWLYQHYDGYNLPQRVALGLEAGASRWLDDEYLTRIIFSHMLAGTYSDPSPERLAQALLDTTGFGIAAGGEECQHGDIEVKVILDIEQKRAAVDLLDTSPETWMSFTEFIAVYKNVPDIFDRGEG